MMSKEEYDSKVDEGTAEDIEKLRARYTGALQTLDIWQIHYQAAATTRSQRALQIILDACDRALLELKKGDN